MIGWRVLSRRSAKSACLALVSFVCFPFAPTAKAINPLVQITQYAHTAWRLQDGTISAPIHAIEQTNDGYFWIGTDNGLLRFDGVRFTPWEPAPGEKLAAPYVESLLKDRDGSLWIGTGRGLSHLVDGHLTNFPAAPGYIEQIIQDPDGTIWFTRAKFSLAGSTGPLCQVKRSQLKCFGRKEGVPFPFANSLARDSQGYLLVGSDTSLIRWKDGVSERYAPKGLKGTTDNYGVSGLLPDRDGSMWIGMFRGGPGMGLQHVVGSQWGPVKLPGLDTSTLAVTNVGRDRDGALWIGTLDKGIYRIYGDHVDHYGASDGLSSDAVYGIDEDSEGDVWVVTSEGLDRFRELPVVTYGVRQGLSSPIVNSVFALRDGSLWMGTSSGIDILRDGNISHLTKRDGLPGEIVQSVFQDHLGVFWMSVDDNLVTYNGKFSTIKTDDGRPVGTFNSITEDATGAIWICAALESGRHVYRVQNRHVQDVNLPEEIQPMSVAADADGGIWLGLLNGQLGSYNDGKFMLHPVHFPNRPPNYPNAAPLRNIVTEPGGTVFAATRFGLLEKRGEEMRYLTPLNGLPDQYLFSFQRDSHGNLYLFMGDAIYSIERQEMERWWDDSKSKISFHRYGPSDGKRPGIAYDEPYTARTTDGRLWVSPGEQGSFQMIDPAHLAFNSQRPPVVIEALVDGETSMPLQDGVRLPPRLHSLRLDYTALSFVAPQNVHFRYRLEGHDTDWQDAGTRRQAFYNDLAPGQYRFHVIASNNDGVWNDQGASLSFYVMPTFYQRVWFKVLIGLLVFAALWLFYIYRLSLATEQVRIRLTERLAERERIARDLHDTFFQGIQGLLLRFNTATTQLPADEPARPIFVAALEQSDQVMLEGRKLVLDLRDTGEDDELEDLLAQAGEDLRSLHPAQFQLTMLGERRALQSTASSELYSLVREALYNAFRHANAMLIEIEVHYTADSLNIRVRDNGRGMDEDVLRDGRRAGHWGLPGMYERAAKLGGTLTLWSRAATGTELEVSVPGAIAYREEVKTVLPEWIIRWFRQRRSVSG